MRADLLSILALLALVTPASARAEATTTTKVKDAASDTKRDVKKGTRTIKRKVRKATGTDTVGKDLKDHVDDAGDDVGAASEKVQHRLNQ